MGSACVKMEVQQDLSKLDKKAQRKSRAKQVILERTILDHAFEQISQGKQFRQLIEEARRAHLGFTQYVLFSKRDLLQEYEQYTTDEILSPNGDGNNGWDLIDSFD
jgi:hypothetical protein